MGERVTSLVRVKAVVLFLTFVGCWLWLMYFEPIISNLSNKDSADTEALSWVPNRGCASLACLLFRSTLRCEVSRTPRNFHIGPVKWIRSHYLT
jgi:hypothetical protein